MTVQMFKRRLLLQGAGLMAGLAASGLAWGQFQVDILGVGANQFPIAVQPFENESACPEDVYKRQIRYCCISQGCSEHRQLF